MNLLLHSPSNLVNPLARQRFMGFGTGVSGGVNFVGPLDDYTADLSLACSIARRLLSSYTGNLIRVRRSSDDAESDIGYAVDGSLDTAALDSFVGANSAYITTVYDQVGSNDFSQLVALSQPRIMASGVIDTLDGLPALYSDGSIGMSGSALTGSAMSLYAVAQAYADPGTGQGALLSNFGSSANQDHMPFSDGNVYYGAGSTTRKSCGNPTPSLAAAYLQTCVSAASSWILRLNSAVFYSTGSNSVGFGTPRIGGGATYAGKGWVREWASYAAAHGTTEWSNIEPIFQP